MITFLFNLLEDIHIRNEIECLASDIPNIYKSLLSDELGTRVCVGNDVYKMLRKRTKHGYDKRQRF